MVLFTLLACFGAGPDTGKSLFTEDSDADTDTDSDADSDADTDTDTTRTEGMCPNALVAPDALDWVEVGLGDTVPKTVSLVNDCTGTGALSILATVTDGAFTLDGAAFSLEPGEVASLAVSFTASDYDAVSTTLTLETNDPDQAILPIPLTVTVEADGDADGHDAEGAGGDDCDDADPSIHGGAAEVWYDGVDQDCDGNDDDQDSDGAAVDVDCDDTDATVRPTATEIWYDGVDQDCDGNDTDQDGDGWSVDLDCDDTEATAFPGGTEIWYDDIDQDCDGTDDDQDGDGWDAPTDCADTDASINPDTTEVWYDGVDQDCDGNDDDQDADGFPVDLDCDESDPTIFPGAADTWYDGVDSNCDDADDYDADADGQRADGWGSDCDDGDATIYDGAADAWYDGVDSDCDGASDFDQDADGYDSDAWGGADCDDADRAVSPAATEIWYDGTDQNCDGRDDDRDGDGYLRAVDCNDTVATTYPGAADAWYDGVDADCDGESDYDADADGQDATPWGADCDDADAAIYDGATETWYDGVDTDCDGASDYDADGDGADSTTYGGTDCNDRDATIKSNAIEIWYDGIDQNCDGRDDDRDNDGYLLAADCNDTAAAINPAATEVWYDGVDQDCSGGSDYDQDGDGVAVYPTGADCDDTDAATVSGSAEVLNGVDDDCNGLVDDGLASAGDLVITEVMANPYSVSDTYGEWFEVYNTTAVDIDLNGWRFYGTDGNSFTVSRSVVVPAGGTSVLGVDDDPSRNGGTPVDYEFSRTSFSLADAGDSIYIASGSVVVASLTWTASWPEASSWSMQLDNDHFNAADMGTMGNWCVSTEAWYLTDLGSPGTANGDCASLDDDADGYTTDDCDDDDVDVNPGADEAENGFDDNCNDFLDEDWGTTASRPYLTGVNTYSTLQFMGAGDFAGDGGNQIVMMETGIASAYLIDGADYTTWGGTLASYDEVNFTANSVSDNWRARSLGSGDVNGDGIADLTYTNVNTSGSFVLYEGPLSSGSSLAPTARFEVTTDSYLYVMIESGFDFDGDGTNEVVFSNNAAARSGTNYAGSVGIFEMTGVTGALDWGDATVRFNGTGNAQCGIEIDPGDFDGDGTTDLSVGCSNDDVYIWLGDALATPGTKTLSSVATSVIDVSGGLSTTGVYTDDLDADGRTDLMLAYSTSRWFLNPGATSGTRSYASPDVSSTAALYGGQGWLDSDGDGIEERVWSDWETGGSLTYTYLPSGAVGGLTSDDLGWVGYGSGVTYASVDTTDLDQDGDTEVLLTSVFYNSYRGIVMVFEP